MKKTFTFLIGLLIGIAAFSQELTQMIHGTVKDEISHSALIGATVKVLGTDPLKGGAADVDGNFFISGIPVGRYNLEISYIGYDTQVIPEVLVTSGKSTQVNIWLKESIIQMDELVIVAPIEKDKPLNEMATVSARSFSVEETRRYAGGFDDPARLTQAFAGVAANSLEDNGIQIRGNAPKGVLWRVEGVELENTSHFNGANIAGGGFITLLSSQVLDNSDFLTGAFPAEYGNALSGVFDINLRTGNPFKRENTFQAGLMGLDFASEGPFKNGAKATYLFNYRYSTFGLIHPLLPEDANYINYQDLSYKLHFPTKVGTFQLWGINGFDRAETHNTLKSDTTQWENWSDFTNSDFGFMLSSTGLNHKIIIGEDQNTYIKSTVAYSLNDGYYREERMGKAGTTHSDTRIDQLYQTLLVSSQVNHKFSSRLNMRSGFIFNKLNFDLHIQAFDEDANTLQTIATDQGDTYRSQFYTQAQLYTTDNVTLNAGLHSQYFAMLNQITLEPRLGIRWKYTPDAALSLGYGNHSRMEDLKIYFVVDTLGNYLNKDLRLTRAHHVVMGWDRKLSPNSRLMIEPYFQYIYEVPVIGDSTFSMTNFSQDWRFQGNLQSTGKAVNYGVDVTLERFLNNNFYYLFTGSLFKSRYMDDLNQWHDTRYDRGYNVDLLAGKEWPLRGAKDKYLGINTRLNFLGGLKRSPLDMEASLRNQEEVLDETRPFTEKDPMTYFLDLSITHRTNKLHHNSIWALQVKNALGSKIYYGHMYNYSTRQMEENAQAIVLPNLSWKIEF